MEYGTWPASPVGAPLGPRSCFSSLSGLGGPGQAASVSPAMSHRSLVGFSGPKPLLQGVDTALLMGLLWKAVEPEFCCSYSTRTSAKGLLRRLKAAELSRVHRRRSGSLLSIAACSRSVPFSRQPEPPPWAAPPAAARLGRARDRRVWVAGCSPGLPPPRAGSAHRRPLPPRAAWAQLLVLVWGGGRTRDAPAKAGRVGSQPGTLCSTNFPEFWRVSHCFVKTIPDKRGLAKVD